MGPKPLFTIADYDLERLDLKDGNDAYVVMPKNWELRVEPTTTTTIEGQHLDIFDVIMGKIRSLDDLDDNDFRRYMPRFERVALEENLKLVVQVEKLAEAKGVSPAEIHLTEDELAALDRIMPKGVAAGERYPESRMAMIDRA